MKPPTRSNKSKVPLNATSDCTESEMSQSGVKISNSIFHRDLSKKKEPIQKDSNSEDASEKELLRERLVRILYIVLNIYKNSSTKECLS